MDVIAELRDLAKQPGVAAVLRFAEGGPSDAMVPLLPAPLVEAVQLAQSRGVPLMQALADENVMATARGVAASIEDAEGAAHAAVVDVLNLVGACPHCRAEGILASFAPITAEAWADMQAQLSDTNT